MYGALKKIVSELLNRRDWAYLGALLMPLIFYDLVLKAASVAVQVEQGGFLSWLKLMRSDILFNAGYGILWIGLFALARRGVARKTVVFFFHAISVLVVVVATSAYQYFQTTGATLDWSVIVFYVETFGEIKDVVLGSTPWYAWVLLAGIILYVVVGPWLLTRVTFRRSPRRAGGETSEDSRLGALGLCVIAFGIGAFSLMPGMTNANRSFSLSPPVNLLITSIRGAEAEALTAASDSGPVVNTLKNVGLQETPRTQKRNVVLIHLESTRARSVTPYNEDLNTTPFLDDLAKQSLLVERAYTTTPHTSKALTSINCGIYPDPDTDIHEAEPDGVPVRCLPDLLKEQNYNTVMFQSATETFEDRPQLADNFGYEDFVGLKDMSKKGFQRAGYLGYEDDILLKPSKEWLQRHEDKPFMASYIGITPHHEYLAPTRYGRKDFAKDDLFNRYLNAVRYDDFWVKNLIQQYKDLGLYENTIFVIYGDHGEAFGEHGVKGHDGVVYEEGLRVPLIVHDPQRWQDGARISADRPVHHMDIPPTILDLLGYKAVRGEYPGSSLLRPPEDRTLYFNCRPDLLCMASTHGYEKYIYHYGAQPDELYDLKKDPMERNNLASEVPSDELKQRREELLDWHSRSAAVFP